MSDGFTILNPGAGGDAMDEECVSYPTAPLTRKRARVELTGSNINEIARVLNTDPSGSEYGVVTRNIPNGIQEVSFVGEAFPVYNTVTLVSSNVETTISQFTVPAGQTFYSLGYVASGDVHARYVLYINGNPVLASRSSVANPTSEIGFKMVQPSVQEGQTIVLKVVHYASGIQGNFEGTILGYIV